MSLSGREITLLAWAAVATSLLLAWLSRNTLNPDGVSYLDLARVLMSGDRAPFVQGYWSPLYPALVALLSVATAGNSAAWIAAAHLVNGIVAIAAAVLLWRWTLRAGRPLLARFVFAAFLIASAGLPRIEAVTPDVLLFALAIWTGYELLWNRGRRWTATGLALGLMFWAKTSAWPWLLLSVPLRLAGARDGAGRVAVLRSSGVMLAVVLCWIVPLSKREGQFTFGSAARLNYCWYIEACDTRTPDTHQGEHADYHHLTVSNGRVLTWAEFPGSDHWTYAPWSDPTAWDRGVVTRTGTTHTALDLLEYWARQLGNVVGLWLLPLLLGILVPAGVLLWRPGLWRELLHEERSTFAVALLGAAGVVQFVLIHAEPRLIAPFAMLLALAVLSWLFRVGSDESPPLHGAPWLRQGLSLVGLVAAIGFAIPRLREGFQASARIDGVQASIASTQAKLSAAGLSQQRIVVIGPAIPVEASAFLSDAHIVAQLPPRSLDLFASLSDAEQREVLITMFGGKASVAWVTDANARVQIAVLPERGQQDDR